MSEEHQHGGRFFQYGVVHGGIGDCGNSKYPNIYARIEDPEIHGFIWEHLGRNAQGKKKEVMSIIIDASIFRELHKGSVTSTGRVE